MPLTEQQRSALAAVRELINVTVVLSGIADPMEVRARQPQPVYLPPDVTVRIEIAPPSSNPHPLLLNTGALRAPERVPTYFYALQNDRADAEAADTHVIFFIHGGGNIVGHPTMGPYIQFFAQILRTLASRAGDASKCVLVAPSYRLATAPENAFPAALQDLVAAYDYVLDKGYKPSNIFLAGDSVGGNHAVVLTYLALQSDRPSPRGIVALAPAAVTTPGPPSDEVRTRATSDIIPPSKGELAVNAYLGDSGAACSDPLISGAFIPFSVSWPRMLVLVGTADLLIDSSRELAKNMEDKKGLVELVEYDERPHAWWVLPNIFPEDVRDATERIAHFIVDV